MSLIFPLFIRETANSTEILHKIAKKMTVLKDSKRKDSENQKESSLEIKEANKNSCA